MKVRIASYFQWFIICSHFTVQNVVICGIRSYYWIVNAFHFCIEPPTFLFFSSYVVEKSLSSSSTRECQNASSSSKRTLLLSLFTLPASAEPGLRTPSTSFAFMPRLRGKSVTKCSNNTEYLDRISRTAFSSRKADRRLTRSLVSSTSDL